MRLYDAMTLKIRYIQENLLIYFYIILKLHLKINFKIFYSEGGLTITA